MTWSALIPIASIIIGWVLGMLSQALNDERSRKRSLGRLLAKLIILEGQVSTAIKATNQLKQMALPPAQQEQVRSKMLQRHFMEGATKLDAMLPLIDESAAFTPVASVHLLSVIELLSKHKTASLEGISNADSNIYERNLAIYDAGFGVLHRELRSICRAYAIRFSWFSYLGLEMRFFRSNRNLKKTKDLMSILGADFAGMLREDT